MKGQKGQGKGKGKEGKAKGDGKGAKGNGKGDKGDGKGGKPARSIYEYDIAGHWKSKGKGDGKGAKGDGKGQKGNGPWGNDTKGTGKGGPKGLSDDLKRFWRCRCSKVVAPLPDVHKPFEMAEYCIDCGQYWEVPGPNYGRDYFCDIAGNRLSPAELQVLKQKQEEYEGKKRGRATRKKLKKKNREVTSLAEWTATGPDDFNIDELMNDSALTAEEKVARIIDHRKAADEKMAWGQRGAEEEDDEQMQGVDPSQADKERYKEAGVQIAFHREQLALWAKMEAGGTVLCEALAGQRAKILEDIAEYEAMGEKLASPRQIKKRQARAVTAAKKDRDAKVKAVESAKALKVEKAKIVEDAVAEVARLESEIPTLESHVEAAERRLVEVTDAQKTYSASTTTAKSGIEDAGKPEEQASSSDSKLPKLELHDGLNLVWERVCALPAFIREGKLGAGTGEIHKLLQAINDADQATVLYENTKVMPIIESGKSYFDALLSTEVDEDDLSALQQVAAPEGAKVPMGKGKAEGALKKVTEKKITKIKACQADSKTTLKFAKMAAKNNDDDV